MIEIDNFKQGQEDARRYYKSQAFSSLTKGIRPEEAIKLFLPPVDEALIMFASPLPKPRQEWIAGFRDEQVVILSEPTECELEVQALRKKLHALSEGKRTLRAQLEAALNRRDLAESRLEALMKHNLEGEGNGS